MRDVLDGSRVALARLPTRARRVAAMAGVLDARPRELAVDRDRAGAQREELPRQPERLAHRGRRIERSVIARTVALDLAGDHQPGELFVRRELQERIVLVVAQDDVVARPVT